MLTEQKVKEMMQHLATLSHLTAYKCEQFFDTEYPEANCEIHTGATKICFVFHDYNYVIKVDYGKSTSYAYEEFVIYSEAKSRQLEKVFPETKILLETNDRTFIAQEKIDFACCELPQELRTKYEHICRTATQKIISKVQQGFYIPNDDYNRTADILWVKMLICLYGKTFAKKLCKLVRDCTINDLHRGNLGYKDNRPIFLDFCGYDGSYYSPCDSSYYEEEEEKS